MFLETAITDILVTLGQWKQAVNTTPTANCFTNTSSGYRATLNKTLPAVAENNTM